MFSSLKKRKSKRIAQILPSFAEKDAIGKQVRIMNKMLEGMGYETKVVANHFPKTLKGITIEPNKMKEKDYEFAIYHHSIGDDIADFVKRLEIPVILYYHNITPPVYYRKYNQRVYELLFRGREQLDALKDRVALPVAVSNFNKRELEKLGYENVKVFPIIFESNWLGKIKEDKKTKNYLNKEDIVDILFVGRYSPNKGHNDLIKAFYLYHKYFNSMSRLQIIGNKVEMEKYVHQLNSLIQRLNLESNVILHDLQDDPAWKAFYRNSDIFVSMSEHEGFFVPALEANYFEIPVLAYNAGAIKDTVGNAGMVLDTKRPEIVAEMIHKIVEKTGGLSQRLIENGKENYGKFEYGELESNFMKIINDFTEQNLNS